MRFFVGCLERVSKQCVELLCSWPSCAAQIGNVPEHENKALCKSDRHVERRPKLFMDFMSANDTQSVQLLPDSRFYSGILRHNLQEFAGMCSSVR